MWAQSGIKPDPHFTVRKFEIYPELDEFHRFACGSGFTPDCGPAEETPADEARRYARVGFRRFACGSGFTPDCGLAEETPAEARRYTRVGFHRFAWGSGLTPDCGSAEETPADEARRYARMGFTTLPCTSVKR